MFHCHAQVDPFRSPNAVKLDTDLCAILVYNSAILKNRLNSARKERKRLSLRPQGEPAMKLRLLVVFVLFSTALLVGQTFRGTILGTVTDPSGAVVAGATVKVRNVGTGQERSTT